MKISSHEAGHCVVASVFGYQTWAYVLPHRGRYIVKGRIIDPVHRAAIGLAGALGEHMIDSPRTTYEKAQRFCLSGRVSTTDWEMVGNEMESSFRGLWLAVDTLREHHSALIQIANLLDKFGEVNPYEVQALCHKSS